jgi:hypothetical protein
MHRSGEPPCQPVGHGGLARGRDTRHEEHGPLQIGHIDNQRDTSFRTDVSDSSRAGAVVSGPPGQSGAGQLHTRVRIAACHPS